MSAVACVIDLIDETGRARPDLARIQAVVDAAVISDGLGLCALTVLIVDDAESSRLHQLHFAAPETTDVMTFPDGSEDPESGRTHLGDLAVCLNVAERAAAERGRNPSDELTLYILHGVLHVLGYDDLDADDQALMWSEQRRLLALVGIALEEHPG
jgi:probable rRNA maturation factor